MSDAYVQLIAIWVLCVVGGELVGLLLGWPRFSGTALGLMLGPLGVLILIYVRPPRGTPE